MLLIYRIPAQPTRLRLQVWRKLQRMGAVYLQNAVCLLPARDDLVENMHYVAGMVEEMGGTCHLFSASALLPSGDERLKQEFVAQSDEALGKIVERLAGVRESLEKAASPSALERAEEELKRERVAYLRARRQAYFGSTKEGEVDAKLDGLKKVLDDLYRSGK